MIYWTEPKIWLLADQNFHEPPDIRVNWVGPEAPAPERLVEFAGRACYLSWHNPAGKTNAQYIEHLVAEEHTSVFEHAVVTFWIQGISRSLSHELVRHRHNSPSQLSQRYVSWHLDAVIPPAELEEGGDPEAWKLDYQMVLQAYKRGFERLKARGLRGKDLSEAARSLLPSACETKMVLTGNATAWRHVIRKRTAPGADAEMRRFARGILDILKDRMPSIFADFS